MNLYFNNRFCNLKTLKILKFTHNLNGFGHIRQHRIEGPREISFYGHETAFGAGLASYVFRRRLYVISTTLDCSWFSILNAEACPASCSGFCINKFEPLVQTEIKHMKMGSN